MTTDSATVGTYTNDSARRIVSRHGVDALQEFGGNHPEGRYATQLTKLTWFDAVLPPMYCGMSAKGFIFRLSNEQAESNFTERFLKHVRENTGDWIQVGVAPLPAL